jgi:hypothetical protein
VFVQDWARMTIRNVIYCDPLITKDLAFVKEHNVIF